MNRISTKVKFAYIKSIKKSRVPELYDFSGTLFGFNFLAHLSVRSHTSGYGSAAYPGLSFEVVRFQSKDEDGAG